MIVLKLSKIRILFSILILSGAFQAKGQIIRTLKGTVKIREFVEDSSQTFASRYVKYRAIGNIKDSKFPVEIRLYSCSMSTDIIDLRIIQSTKDSAIINTKRIWFASKAGIPNYTKVYENDKFSVNLFSRPKRVVKNKYYDFYDELLKNELFSVQGVDDTKTFKSGRENKIDDGNSAHWIEIKVGNYFRNFSYSFGGGLTDPNESREKKMREIINLITNTLTIKYNEQKL